MSEKNTIGFFFVETGWAMTKNKGMGYCEKLSEVRGTALLAEREGGT